MLGINYQKMFSISNKENTPFPPKKQAGTDLIEKEPIISIPPGGGISG